MNANHTNRVRIFEAPPRIDALPAEAKRCKWSVMIPVYNCAEFLPETLKSVLAQALPAEEMQIEVVDDCSTDADVEKIVTELGNGRVGYFRQSENVGSLRNFLTCIQRSRGELIHLLHGDDRIRPGFYAHIGELFHRHPSLGAAYSRFAYIDETGNFLFNHDEEMHQAGVLTDQWLERISERQRIQYAAIVVKREVYERLGGFYGVEYGEDWEMWVRISAHYPMGYTPQILAEYRKHSLSISGRAATTGKNMEDLGRVIENIQHFIPEQKRKRIVRESKKFYAHYALRIANTIWKKRRHKAGANAQMTAAWKMYKDIALAYKILKLYTKVTLNL